MWVATRLAYSVWLKTLSKSFIRIVLEHKAKELNLYALLQAQPMTPTLT